MNTFKKLLAVIMLVCMLVTLLPAGAAYAAATTGTVNISVVNSEGSTPISGVTVSFNGISGSSTSEATDANGAATILLPVGTYTWLPVTPAGYAEATGGTINVTEAGPNTVNLSLDPLHDVTFTCSPADLALTVANATLVSGDGTASRVYRMAAGQHTYTATKDDFEPSSASITVPTETSKEITLKPLYTVTFEGPAGTVVSSSSFSPVTLTDGTGTCRLTENVTPYSFTASWDGGYKTIDNGAFTVGEDGAVSAPTGATISESGHVVLALPAVYPVSITGTPGAVVTFTDSSPATAGASVTLDAAGLGTKYLPEGTYTCNGALAHYDALTTPASCTVTDAGGSVAVNLTKTVYHMAFKDSSTISDPDGVTISVVDSEGNTVTHVADHPYWYDLTYGNYKYTASKPGYQTIEESFTPSNRSIPITLEAVQTVTFTADGSTALPAETIIKVSKAGSLVKTLTVSSTAGSNQCELTAGEYSYVAGVPGKTASGSFTVESAALPVSVPLADCTTHTDTTPADGKCDSCYGVIVASIGNTNYLSLAAAYSAAADTGSTITLVSSPTGTDGNLTVAKDVTLVGSSKTLGIVTVSSNCTLGGFTSDSIAVSAGNPTLSNITTGAVTVTGGSPTLNTVTATGLTASGSAIVTLNGCTIPTLASNSASSKIYVNGGSYSSVSGIGNFSIKSGAFVNYVDASYCKDGDTQYYAKKNASTGKYDIEALTPDVTAVSESGEFVKDSGKTLAFTTNIPWEIKGHITSVKVGADPLSDAQYTVTSSGAATAPTTVVTLTNAYLQAIATPGTYTLTILTSDGNATEDFVVTTVAGAANVTPNANGVCPATTQPGATISAADITRVSGANTGLLVTTSGGQVSFDDAAVDAINTALTAAGSGSATLMITKTGDPSTVLTFTLTLNNGAIASFGAGAATVTLNVGSTCPATISHTHGGVTDVYYPSDATGSPALPSATDTNRFAYASNGSATLKVTGFSTITTNVPTVEIGTANQLPNTVAGAATDTAYGPITFSATGGTGYTWSMTGGAPAWLTMTAAGVLSGTVPANTTAQTWTMTVTATDTANTANNKTETFSLTAVSAGTPFEVRHANGTASNFYATFAAAHDAAATVANDSIIVHSTPTLVPSISVSKNIAVYGNGYTIGTAITTTGDCSLNNLGATSLTAGGAGVAKLNGCAITTVTSTATRMDITSGAYGTINGTGDYSISGGAFNEYIYPVDCLRYATSTGAIAQYYSYPSATGVWTVTGPLVPQITAVSNGAYHMRRSTSTIAFTTNIPYSLNADVRDVRVGTTSLTGSRYTMYSSNGNDTGYIVIALDDLYLNSLNLGYYRLTIDTLEGSPYADFEIGNTVRTGDSANMPLWMGLMGGSVLLLIGAAAYIMLKNKKKKNTPTDEDTTPKT